MIHGAIWYGTIVALVVKGGNCPGKASLSLSFFFPVAITDHWCVIMKRGGRHGSMMQRWRVAMMLCLGRLLTLSAVGVCQACGFCLLWTQGHHQRLKKRKKRVRVGRSCFYRPYLKIKQILPPSRFSCRWIVQNWTIQRQLKKRR
jgi:hypothetical protein